MQVKFDRVKQMIRWLLVLSSLVLWIVSVTKVDFYDLSFVPPYQKLDLFFWLGLFIVVLNILQGSKEQKILSLIILMFYFIVTLSVIFKYPIMHDSVMNATNFPNLQSHNPYVQSYWGTGLIFNAIQSIFGGDSWQMARFFPSGVGIAYILILGLFYFCWKEMLSISFFSFCLFTLFFIAFGETFYLRINASPQTIAYLWFFFSISILPLTHKFIFLKVIFLFSLFMMIISHPISPLLALPGLGAAVILVDKQNNGSILHTVEFLILVVVGYLTWTLYMGNWIVKYAVRIILNALETDKFIDIINRSPDMAQIDNYIFWHRILLISILTILFVCYLLTIKSRVGLLVTIWGAGLLPAFLILLSYPDFFDRILLFGLLPCAIVFADGSQRLIARFPKIKLPAAGLLIGLVLLSAYVAYFFIGAVDRITADEVKANQYLSTLGKPISVYTNGFNLPNPDNITYLTAIRGVIDVNQAKTADVIVITSQMENAAIINPRAPIQVSDFIKLIQQDYILSQTFGQARVFIRASK